MTDAVETRIAQFLREECGWSPAPGQDPRDVALLDEGVLDSLRIVALITTLEEHFGVAIPEEEFLPENFESVAAVSALVRQLERVR